MGKRIIALIAVLLCAGNCWGMLPGFHKVPANGGEPTVTEITLLDSTTASVGSGSSISINVPTVYNGNLLTLSVVNDDGGTISTPSGWTSQGSVAAGSSAHAIFTKIASSEPASYTVTNSGSTSLVAVMSSWQKPSGAWSVTSSFAGRESIILALSPMFSTSTGDMLYVGWGNDAGYSITGGPYTGSTGTTPAENMVSLARSAVSSISIDTYYEPMGTGSGSYRHVDFSASEDSAIGLLVISYE